LWANAPRTPKQKKRLPRVSKKRRVDSALYAKKRKAFLEGHPYCMAYWTIVMSGVPVPVMGFYGNAPATTEIHHTKKPRCKYLNDESTWLAVSAWSHRWIEDHKTAARSLGLLQ
jgi:hypothetical protein